MQKDDIIFNRMNKTNNYNSKYATLNSDAKRLVEEDEDIRPIFFHDTDRILYTLSFSRYLDKTQVFSIKENDHISRRMMHVQFVSKIARTIGRALGLNEDLIEAASLGHDLGHTPLGHAGEYILNKISLENNEGYFNHNVQSVRALMNIENYGKGVNLSIQTLDAILCHNGEFLSNKLTYVKKTEKEFLEEYYDTYKNKDRIKSLKPMTLEGCVVRICDIIGYLGRDIEDALRLKLIKVEDIPKDIKEVLGTKNREIISKITNDIIDNSFDKPYIEMSEKVYRAVKELKDFNYHNIYLKANSEEEMNNYEKMFRELFDVLLKQLESEDSNSDFINSYLKNLSEYYNNNSNARKVIDYISGMTDNFFVKQYEKYVIKNR